MGVQREQGPVVNVGVSKVHKVNEPERWEKEETWGMTYAILNLITVANLEKGCCRWSILGRL